MYLFYLSIMSVFFAPAICAMDWHQRVVASQYHGVDLLAVVPLANHSNCLPGAAQRKSIRELFDECNPDTQNFSNKIGLYALVNDTVVEYGSLASCGERKQLLASCMASLYVLYTENEKEKRALFLGTSDTNNACLLMNYLTRKASLLKQNASHRRGNRDNIPALNLALNNVIAYWHDGKMGERAV